jgi:hypothetical protein
MTVAEMPAVMVRQQAKARSLKRGACRKAVYPRRKLL